MELETQCNSFGS